MRVCFFLTDCGSGGIQTWVLQATSVLVSRGVAVHVIVESLPHTRCEMLRDRGATVTAFDLPQPSDTYARLLKDWNADLVHYHIWERQEHIVAIGKAVRIPSVFHHHFDYPVGRFGCVRKYIPGSKIPHGLEGILPGRLSYDAVDLHLCCSHSCARNIRRRFAPFRPPRLVVLPNFIVKEPRMGPKKKDMGPCFLQVGHLREAKNPQWTIDAFRDVQNVCESATLTFVGDGRLRGGLESFVETRGVRNVLFAGVTNDVESFYLTNSVLLLPSDSEAFPFVLIEAAAYGLAAIATRVGGVPEIVSHRRTGLLISPRKRVSLADAMIRLATDEHMRKKLGLGAYRRFERMLDAQVVAEKLLTLYSRLT